MSFSLAAQLAASATSITSTYLYGTKSLWGPALGMLASIPWVALMCADGLWGLLPINVVMLVVHGRNFRKWCSE